MGNQTQIIKCTHDIVCLRGGNNGKVLIHPADMNVCSDSAVPVNQIPQVDPPTTISGEGNDTVISAHRAVRDGSVWLCLGCRSTRPFGALSAAFIGPCEPVRWGDRPVTTGYER